ncbi:MAG: hypothetical protein ACE5KT_07975 [Methanosarcinales archaeon]
MSKTVEILSKTKYSNINELIEEAKKIAVDHYALQISIEKYLQTRSDFDLKAIIHAVEYKHELEALANP